MGQPVAVPSHVLKLRRAHDHLDVLKDAIQQFVDSKPYTFRIDPHPKPPDYVIRAHINQAPPDDFGLAIGDFAHNARSALDVLVYRLSRLPESAKRERRHLAFPIFANPEDFHEKKARLLNGIDACHVSFIEAAQPYNGSRRDDPLAILREINNRDKHCVVTTVGAIGREPSITLNRPQRNVGKIVMRAGTVELVGFGIEWASAQDRAITEDGAIVARITAKNQMQIDMNQDLEIDVQFGKGVPGIQGRQVVNTLSEIRDRVQQLLAKF